jgi:methionyl-tRNA formyltransferase
MGGALSGSSKLYAVRDLFEMRILFLGNNWVASHVAGWLRAQGEEIVGLVVHPAEQRSHGVELIRAAAVPTDRVFDGSQIRRHEIVEQIRALNCDIGVSVLFGYILRPQLLDMFPNGCINLHPALLPYNRGAYPNVWSIIDGTPAGVTLHYVDPGVDTGDIIAQMRVEVEPIDTGETLYRKLEHGCIDLFADTWPLVRSGQAPRHEQPQGVGTSHRLQDVRAVDEIQLEQRYRAREILNLLRARTFPPYPSAYFMENGRRIYVRVQLAYEDE